MAPLIVTETYHDWTSSSIDVEGVSIPQGVVIDASGAIAIYALALPPAQAYDVMLDAWATMKPVEMIFAFDRFAQAGQGTTLGDLMAGHYFVRDQPSRPFIIEYQHEPRIVHPMVWDNAWWNAALTRELASVMHTRGRAAR